MPRTGAPIVSVIITAYNAERWIAETLESVLAQTWCDFEVVVVDDGSTDGTAEVVKNFDSRVRYLHQENRGQPAARNAGIRAARGRYIAFVDADDLWMPEKLEAQMALFQKRPDLVWCYTDSVLFESATGKILHAASQENALHEGCVLRPLLLGNFILSPTPVVRRDIFEEVGGFREDAAVRGGGGEDWNMWLRIAAQHPVGLIHTPLAKCRVHGASMTRSMDLEHALQGRLSLVQEVIRRYPHRTAGVQRRAVSNVYTSMGRWALNREKREKAFRFFAQALRHVPTSRYAWTYVLAALLPRPVLHLLGRLRRVLRGNSREHPPRKSDTLMQEARE